MAFNVVPAYVSASIAVRVAADYNKTVQMLEEAVVGVEHVRPFSIYCTAPQYLDYDVPRFDTIVLAYTTDIPNLTHNLVHCYLYGPGSIHVAHGDHEYVENQDLLDAVDGHQRLVEHILKQ